MAKVRVGQLAKEMNLKVSDLLARLRELGAEVKSNLSTVDDEIAARVRSAVPSSEKHTPEIPKGAPARSVTAAGGRATVKSPSHRQPVAPGSTIASAEAKGTSIGSHPAAQTPPAKGSVVRPLAGAIKPASKPLPGAPPLRPAAARTGPA